MAYKDKDRQREAVKRATRRYRERRQGITASNKTSDTVIPEQSIPVIPSKPEQQSYNPMMVGYVPPGR